MESGPAEAAVAAEAATQAAPGWAACVAARAAQLQRAVEAIAARQDKLTRLMTREQGKPLGESAGEMKRALAEGSFMIGEEYRLYGDTVPSDRPHGWAQTVRVPVGPVAAITPWNLPVTTLLRTIMPALIPGNPAVLKPSELTPLTALRLVEMMNGAGLPAGVLTAITGGQVAGEALIDHHAIRAVTFTGSTATGRAIYAAAARRLVRVQAEMGGKNPVVLWDAPDLDDAIKQIVGAAFQCTGQRCTAISRVIVPRREVRAIERALITAVEQLRPGNGMTPGVTLGPLVSVAQLESVDGYVRRALAEGARLLTGGRRLAGGDFDKGNFYPVTQLADVTPNMEIARKEVFGPVLTIQPVDSFAEALELANDVEYGLTAAIFTRDLELAGHFVDGVQSGIVHVNHGTSSEPHLPFGGAKASGVGPGSIGSTTKDFFTDIKTVYVKYA